MNDKYICIDTYVLYVYMYVYVCIYIQVYVCVFILTHIYLHIYIGSTILWHLRHCHRWSTNKYIHIDPYMYTNVHTYIQAPPILWHLRHCHRVSTEGKETYGRSVVRSFKCWPVHSLAYICDILFIYKYVYVHTYIYVCLFMRNTII
jgi:hypothetical protein